mgnify:CR=1 FL=1
MKGRFWIHLAGAVLAAVPRANAQEIWAPVDTVIINPGDAVRIVVWRKPELSGDFDIAADGSVKHPLYQELRLGGRRVDEAEVLLREFLSRFETAPQFVFEPLYRVSVTGEVRMPNLYSLSPETTVAQAIARAGGATERGRLDRVTVVRAGRQKIVVDLTEPKAGAADVTVRSGDRIIVERRANWFREYLAPMASLIAAGATLLNVLTR